MQFLETSHLARNVIADMNIGLWVVESDEGKEPRMFCDEKMLELLGVTDELSPEELYKFWFENIDPAYSAKVFDSISSMINGTPSEVQYPWNHPAKGPIFVRCGGHRDMSHKDGLRLEGCHRNITSLCELGGDSVQKTGEARQFAVISELAGDFDCVNYVVLCGNRFDDIAIPYRTSEQFLKIIPGWLDENRFHNRLELMEEYLVYEEDKNDFHTRTRRAVVKKEIEANSSYSVNFRAEVGNEILYYQLKFAGDRDENGNIVGMVAGVRSIDEEIKNQMEVNTKLEQNLKIIDVLASQYSSVYYIELSTGKLMPYVMNEKTESELGQIFRKEISYQEAFSYYVSKLVFESDRDRLLRAGSIQNIKKMLEDQKSFTTTYRNKREGFPHFCEMKFVKMDDEREEPTAVALAFADKDEEILGHYIEENLCSEYASIYLADLENDIYRAYRYLDDEDITSRADSSWSSLVKEFAAECSEDNRDIVLSVADPKAVEDMFRNQDRREYLYKNRNANNSWRRCVLQVIDRKEGRPVALLVCVAVLDEVAAEKEELNTMLAEQKMQLEAQQVALEQALQMSQAADRAKTAFLNNMSHDIRTPMNAIIGFSTLAISRIDNRDIVKDYLRKIGQASEHLLSLINDVLDMSRIESGKMNLSEKEENLMEIMQILRDMVQADVIEKQLHFRVSANGAIDENIICDKLRINQILLNVVSNAVKYTPDCGSIEVTFSETGVSDRGYGMYEILVRDTGIGMSEEFLKTIYDPFTRVNNATVTGIQGTGLGMAITKNLVDMMGGSIEIKSKPNEGTEVYLRFEFKLAGECHFIKQKANEEPFNSTIPDIAGMKVLLVEDVQLNLELAQQMLEDCGITVTSVMDGTEAVEAMEQAAPGDFDLILMDIQMPLMDGYEATKRIRALDNPEIANIPIIAMTANAFAEDRQNALDAGMNDHIAKPIKMDRIVEALMRIKPGE